MVPKMRPRTKHLNNVYHHFRESVQNNEVTLIAVRSDEQLADLLTKPLPDNLFQHFRDKVLNSTTAYQKPLGEGVGQYYNNKTQIKATPTIFYTTI